jgi:hypothetical protein
MELRATACHSAAAPTALLQYNTSAESGAALAQLVVNSALEKTSGKYFEGTRQIPSSDESYDEGCSKQLWQDSLVLTGLEDAVA